MKTVFYTILLLGFGIINFAFGQNLIRNAYVQMSSPTGVTICWRTSGSEDSEVLYGTSISNLNQSVKVADLVKNHSVRIEGLSPESKYYYTFGSSTQKYNPAGETYHFITNPPVGSEKPIRFLACGDMGSYNSRQIGVRNAFVNFNANQHIDGWLVLGDIIYGKDGKNGGDDSLFTTGFFTYYDTLIRNTVAWPAPGNHDYESVSMFQSTGPYFENYTVPTNGEIGGTPSNTEAYYSYDYANAHFISLNSENWQWATSNSSPQANWLKQDMAATSQTWKIAYWHAPPYTKGSHDSDSPFILGMMGPMRENYVPILEEFNIDLVICGHSHNYERSKLVNGHYGASGSFNPSVHQINGGSGSGETPYLKQKTNGRGAVYIVSGCGGKLDNGSGSLNHPVMYISQDTVGGSSFIDIHGDTMRVRFVSQNGNVLDDFTIIKTDSALNRTSVTMEQNKFKLAPNPAKTVLNLNCELNAAAEITIQIYDINGRLTAQPFENRRMTIGSHTLNFDETLSQLPAGVYMMKIGQNGQTQALRFTKMN